VNGGVDHFQEKNNKKSGRKKVNKEKKNERVQSDLKDSRGLAEKMKDT